MQRRFAALPSVVTASRNTEEIRSFLTRTAKDQMQLHQFITPELVGKDAAMMIDTGFWGTCAAYASVYMEIAHGACIQEHVQSPQSRSASD